jgi:GDPmannose 4,6-dehydratase
MGNLNSQRDWGHAKDYIRAMYLILQQEKPSDYVIATGITTTIRDFIDLAAQEIGLQLEFRGENADEIGVLVNVDQEKFIEKVGDKYLDQIVSRAAVKDVIVGVDKRYFRPTEVDLLIGDPTKSRTVLGWEPRYDLAALIADMMQSDIKLMQRETYLKEGGYDIMNYFE